MRCYAQNPPLQCQDAWTGTGPGTSQKYPTWTWMKVCKTANSSQVIKSVGKKVPHQNYRNSLNDIQWIQWIQWIQGIQRTHVYTFFLENSPFASPLWRTPECRTSMLLSIFTTCLYGPNWNFAATVTTSQQVTGNGPNWNRNTCSPGPGVFKWS